MVRQVVINILLSFLFTFYINSLNQPLFNGPIRGVYVVKILSKLPHFCLSVVYVFTRTFTLISNDNVNTNLYRGNTREFLLTVPFEVNDEMSTN